MPLTFRIERAYQLTGERSTDPTPLPVSVNEFCQGLGIAFENDTQYLIRFRWDSRITFLKFHGSWSQRVTAAEDERPQVKTTRFAAAEAAKSLFLATLPTEWQNSDLAWEEELKAHQTHAAAVPSSVDLNIGWKVDTNSPAFCQCKELLERDGRGTRGGERNKVLEITYATERRNGKLVKAIKRILVRGIVDVYWQQGSGWNEIEGAFEVEIKPGSHLPKYDGHVAVDFGNTNSTLACVSKEGIGQEDLVFVDCEPKSHSGTASSVVTAVGIKNYKPLKNGVISPANWIIGDNARRVGPNDDLLLGAKRILANPNDEALKLKGGDVLAPHDLPAELMLTSMLRSLYTDQLGFPLPVAVTYPTTFTNTEIERTREAVFKALRRSSNQRTYLPTKPVAGAASASRKPGHQMAALLDKWVPREHMLDEATAAAFFFLYRDFIRNIGRMPAFYFEYPKGVNLLLYDCGGGTTDIALIHCRVYPDAAAGTGDKVRRSSHTWQIRIRVLGRTGHRDFGGDDITLAVFRILKAGLAARIVERVGHQPLDWDRLDSSEVAEWLKRHERRLHDYVPTNWTRYDAASNPPFRPLRLRGEDVQLRRDVMLGFWEWAEKVKCNITKVEGYQLPETGDQFDHPLAPPRELIAPLAELVRGEHPEIEESDFYEFLPAVLESHETIRERVDAVIEAELDKTVFAANHAVRERLEEATRPGAALFKEGSGLPPDSAVHRVYVVGKASHYPTIREMLERELIVNELQAEPGPGDYPSETNGDGPGRLRFEADVLKECVAGGAVFAMLAKNNPDLNLDFDQDLSRRLPFSIGWDSADGFKVLYREDLKYDELDHTYIHVAEERQQDTTVFLWRRWPGQEYEVARAGSSLAGCERYMRFDFSRPPKGPLKLEYKRVEGPTGPGAGPRKSFVITDEGGIRERVTGREVAGRVFVSPPQRGDL